MLSSGYFCRVCVLGESLICFGFRVLAEERGCSERLQGLSQRSTVRVLSLEPCLLVFHGTESDGSCIYVYYIYTLGKELDPVVGQTASFFLPPLPVGLCQPSSLLLAWLPA